MSNINYIINLCHDINENGKKPSVALIKNQANTPLSIPEIIKGLQHWKANPKQGKKDIPKVKAATSSSTSLEQRVTILEQQLAMVLEELTSIHSLVGPK